ncbi:hypothetical protein, partial [Rhodoplanes sp. SY1]|uniref:hypothetical protein n=1 Tax=Rhodoplanes sp. SY1 TaxID=3166646 RepID=UPI0038B595D4
PISAVDFTIQTTGDVVFQATTGGRSDLPLSAGGGVTVTARNITQGGNLFAPLGRITLTATVKVTLAPGSLTSVTLAGALVPYGETIDGTNWYYNAKTLPFGVDLPSKGLVLDGANVTIASGATIDARGGGDLQAMEWIQGKGGSRDVLATTSGQKVYALVPSINDPVAAFDIHFTTTNKHLTTGGVEYLGADDYPLAGTQIRIDGGNGIPAGVYTLYPGHYATLPGALRVTYYGSNLGRNLPSGTTLPDGTVLVTGNYTQSTNPSTSSFGSQLFAVQSSAVWRSYSEYSYSLANTYFTEAAVHAGVTVPRLPIDAGRLSVIASASIKLFGTALSGPAPGGRGSELDISADKLAIVDSGQFAAGTVPG